MKIENLSERFRAVEKLQSIRDCPTTSTATSAEADYAIDLALSPSRKVDKYLVDNALRDARHILGRKQIRDERLMVSLDAVLPGLDDDGTEMTLHDVVPSSLPTPDESFLTAEVHNRITGRFSGNVPARAVIAALARGESLAEAAQSSGVSLSYAKKLRQVIREKAASIALN